jgi:hypothetical protein
LNENAAAAFFFAAYVIVSAGLLQPADSITVMAIPMAPLSRVRFLDGRGRQ